MGTINLLEQRIQQKAKERFEKEFSDFTQLISSNPIGQKLQITVNKSEGVMMSLVCSYGTTGATFFNRRFENITEYGNNLTNIQAIREILIAQFIKEETDTLLTKLDVLRDFLNVSE
jgi:hypothetical protein